MMHTAKEITLRIVHVGLGIENSDDKGFPTLFSNIIKMHVFCRK